MGEGGTLGVLLPKSVLHFQFNKAPTGAIYFVTLLLI